MGLNRRFLVIHDYQWGGGGFFLYAPSIEAASEALGLPRQGFELIEKDILEHPYVKYVSQKNGVILARDAEYFDVVHREDLATGERLD